MLSLISSLNHKLEMSCLVGEEALDAFSPPIQKFRPGPNL